jgi:hypothetical protein
MVEGLAGWRMVRMRTRKQEVSEWLPEGSWRTGWSVGCEVLFPAHCLSYVLGFQLRAAEVEIKDLQSEFELEKIDYLATIRRQERDSMLLQQLLEQVQPLIRRDCNYSSLEKIRRESSWDEDNGFWKIPEPIIIKTSLPVGQELGCPRPLLLPSQLPTLQRVREPGFSLQAVGAVDTWPQLSDTLGS